MINYLEKNRRFAILFMVLIGAEIFFVSSIPGSKVVSGGIDASMLYHLLVFFLFNFFVTLSITKRKNKGRKYLILPIIISILYAILDEIHQIFVPLRNSSVGDVLTDVAGILLSVLVYLYYKRNNKK